MRGVLFGPSVPLARRACQTPMGEPPFLAAPHEVVIPVGEEVNVIAEAVCQMIGGLTEEAVAIFYHVVDELDAQIVISYFFDLLFFIFCDYNISQIGANVNYNLVTK